MRLFGNFALCWKARGRGPAATRMTSCSAPYFQSQFAEEQTAWREQGRFLIYCNGGGGFGAWLKGLSAAFVISILSERALVLNGSCRELPTPVGRHVAAYFRGRGFDWTDTPLRTGQRRREQMVSPVCRARVRPCGYNRTAVHGELLADATLLSLHGGEWSTGWLETPLARPWTAPASLGPSEGLRAQGRLPTTTRSTADRIRDRGAVARVLGLLRGDARYRRKLAPDGSVDVWRSVCTPTPARLHAITPAHACTRLHARPYLA